MAYNVVSSGEVTHPQAHFNEIGKFPVILFKAQLAPGSSGGAIVNEKGEYIGTTNWGVGMLAMASPVSNLINLLKKLKLDV
jgi:S1-C subfamily serine protease